MPNDWYKSIINFYDKTEGKTKNNKASPKSLLHSGVDFEMDIMNKLKRSGHNVEKTSATNDQGVDLILRLPGKTVAIQCKFYSGKVGNKAVQEVSSGRQYYSLDFAVVITNSSYTSSAYSLAEKCNVVLISGSEIDSFCSNPSQFVGVSNSFNFWMY